MTYFSIDDIPGKMIGPAYSGSGIISEVYESSVSLLPLGILLGPLRIIYGIAEASLCSLSAAYKKIRYDKADGMEEYAWHGVKQILFGCRDSVPLLPTISWLYKNPIPKIAKTNFYLILPKELKIRKSFFDTILKKEPNRDNLSFQDLPFDLLRSIFSNLSQNDLTNCSLVCHNWKNITSVCFKLDQLHNFQSYDANYWENHFDLPSLGLDVTDAPQYIKRDLSKIIQSLQIFGLPYPNDDQIKPIWYLLLNQPINPPIEKLFFLTLPKGLTISKLLEIKDLESCPQNFTDVVNLMFPDKERVTEILDDIPLERSLQIIMLKVSIGKGPNTLKQLAESWKPLPKPAMSIRQETTYDIITNTFSQEYKYTTNY